jgi:hypothetical protein
MQLQLIHKAIKFILELNDRATKHIFADARVDEDSKV